MRRILALALSLALVACGSDSTSEPTSQSIAGTWSLQTVNGSPLPFTLSQAGTTKIEVVSDVVTAVSTGSYTEITQIRTTSNGQATTESQTDAGTFTLSGTAVTLRSNDGSTVTGSVNGDTFTLTQVGLSLVYKRQ